FSAAGAYVADVTPQRERAQGFGLIGAAFGMGFILGPALGVALAALSLALPYLLAAGLNFANLLYGLFVLPESLRPEDRRAFSLRRAKPIGAPRGVAANPLVLRSP